MMGIESWYFAHPILGMYVIVSWLGFTGPDLLLFWVPWVGVWCIIIMGFMERGK